MSLAEGRGGRGGERERGERRLKEGEGANVGEGGDEGLGTHKISFFRQLCEYTRKEVYVKCYICICSTYV